MELRTCSKARPAANMAKEEANTTLPAAAMPAATARGRWSAMGRPRSSMPTAAEARAPM